MTMSTIHRSAIILILFSALTHAPSAQAQEITRMPDAARQSVGFEGGLESAFVAWATYTHRVDFGLIPDERLFARFTMPVVALDLGDWAIDGGMRATPLTWGDVRLAVLAGPVLRHTANELFSATAGGLGATALFGYEGPRWGLSAELRYEQMLTTYLRHSDLYHDRYYAGAKDGWYAITGAVARAGLRGGVRFSSVEISVRAGVAATGALHALTPPFYVTLGSTYAF